MMTKYTIAICNYNMSDSINRSLQSVINQVDEEFEILVVDGGSTDGSINILQRLSDDYDNLRYIISPYGPQASLGTDRALSIVEARGQYVITHVDTDNVYDDIITDFTTLYHEIETKLDDILILEIGGLIIAPRDYIIKMGSYRDLDVSEDIDLIRRIIASDNSTYIKIKCPSPETKIANFRGPLESICRHLDFHTCDYQSGISFQSSIKWAFRVGRKKHGSFLFILLIIAYLRVARRKKYTLNESVSAKGFKIIRDRSYSINELENQYNISIDKSIFSNSGKEYLDLN